MIIKPRIEPLLEKKLIGKHLSMSLAEDRTYELWKIFMLHRKEITNNLTADLISMQIYDQSFDFNDFNPHALFEKWATVEVSDFSIIPQGMEPFILAGGLYAVFIHKGAASTGPKTYQYIFVEWLPNSAYLLDNRPHFEILGEKYKNESPDSEEEIWIPVKLKQ